MPKLDLTGILVRASADGSKRYLPYVYVPASNGRPGHREYLGTFTAPTRAAKARRHALNRLASGTYQADDTHGTVEAARELWLASAEPSDRKPSTLSTYASSTKAFVAAYGDVTIAEITTEFVTEWARTAPRSQRSAVRTMFNHAFAAHPGQNPWLGLRFKKAKGRRDIVPPSVDDVAQFSQVARETCAPPFGITLAALIDFAAWSGARPGEILGLRPEDVDFAEGEIHVLRQLTNSGFQLPKNGHTRTIALLPPAAEALRRLPAFGPYLFRSPRGRLLRPSNLWHYWNAIRNIAGQPNRHFYELRHFCGSYLWNEVGLEAEQVAWQLGHRDGGKLVEEVYGHRNNKKTGQRVRDRFDRFVQGEERSPNPLTVIPAPGQPGRWHVLATDGTVIHKFSLDDGDDDQLHAAA
jgi:integrase